MRKLLDHAATYLLFTYATVWPWGVYQYVPVVNGSLTTLVTGLLAILFLAGLRERGFPVSFEIIWPLALMALLVLAVSGQGTAASLLGLTLFMAVRCLALSRRIVEQLIIVSTLSTGCVAIFALGAGTTAVIPTAYSLTHKTTLAFPYDIPSGVFTLLMCLAAAPILCFSSRYYRAIRIAAGAAFACSAVLLASLALQAFKQGNVWMPPVMAYSTPQALTFLLILWMVARVAAKVEIGRQETGDRFHIILLAMFGVGALCTIAMPISPRPEFAFLLALACAYASPRTVAGTPVKVPFIPVLVLICLVPLNATLVYPEHDADPRNYEAAAQRAFRKGELEFLSAKLDSIEKVAPGERRVHLWRARIELEHRRPKAAANEFVSALKRGGGHQLLPGPTPSEQEDFKVRLRDLCSQLSDAKRGLAYEKVLAASGDVDETLAALRLRLGKGTPGTSSGDSAKRAENLASILGNRALMEPLAKWAPSELEQLHELVGR